MAPTLYIGDDILTAEAERIFDDDDFVQLVRERLGSDAEKYLNSIIKRADGRYDDGYEKGYTDGRYYTYP